MALLLMVLICVCCCSLLIGPATEWSQYDEILFGQLSVAEFWRWNHSIFELRLVHILLSAGVGLALATAGRAMQLFLQNPLADPHIVGLSSGSTASVLLCLLFFPAFANSYFFDFLPSIWFAAVVGALFTLILVHLIFAGFVRRWEGASLALAGLMVNAGLAALLMFIFARLSPAALSQVQSWTLGAIQPYNLRAAAVLVPFLMAAAFLLIRLDRPLRLMSFGSEFALSNGIPVTRIRSALLLGLVVVSAASVCAAGSVGFVGLLVPHLSRRFFSAESFSDFRPWLNGVLGSIVMVVADLASRTLTAPFELPIGIYTALLSLPFLFIVLIKQRSPES